MTKRRVGFGPGESPLVPGNHELVPSSGCSVAPTLFGVGESVPSRIPLVSMGESTWRIEQRFAMYPGGARFGVWIREERHQAALRDVRTLSASLSPRDTSVAIDYVRVPTS